jgi:hypothetical protein
MTIIGSKVQVWRGVADQTSSGLSKKDLTRKKIDGKWRYRSKKQMAVVKKKGQKSRIRWTAALKKARVMLRKEYPESSGKLVLVLKPSKKYSGLRVTKNEKKWGNFLYKTAKLLYSSSK